MEVYNVKGVTFLKLPGQPDAHVAKGTNKLPGQTDAHVAKGTNKLPGQTDAHVAKEPTSYLAKPMLM